MTDVDPGISSPQDHEAETLRIADEAAKRLLRPGMSPHAWGSSMANQIDHAYAEGDDETVRSALAYEEAKKNPKN